MEGIKQTVKIPANHEVRVKIPSHIPENEEVDIIVLRKNDEDQYRKIEDLKSAMKDPLFLDDLHSINYDFAHI